MKKTTQLLLFFCLATAGCKKYADTIPVIEITKKDLPANYISRLNKVFDSSCAALELKGASVALIVPNKGVWKRAYGISHTGTLINTDMLFSIGSNTKTFTAAAILKLQEKGLLHINDTIGKWFKNIKYIDGKITIRQLLNHTSGMGYYDSSALFQNAIFSNFQKIWADAEFYPFLVPAHFKPGTKWDYSNTNFVLLGFIINKVTGRPVKDVMREFIFTPAGLTKTFYFPFEKAQGVLPHFWSSAVSGNFEDITVVHNYSPNAYHSLGGGADGCILSTAGDNTKFWFALFNGKIITKNSLELMQQFIPESATSNYGYGLGLERYTNINGRTLAGHTGGVIGGININGYDYTSKVHLSIHTNQDIIVPTLVLEKLHLVTTQFE
jgi:D-alanyl-D-alanine carboxypeptidase